MVHVYTVTLKIRPEWQRLWKLLWISLLRSLLFSLSLTAGAFF